MLSIGVLGDSNAGKSTLLNVLLGTRVLPTSKTSCTSTLVHCVLDGGTRKDEVVNIGPGECVLVHGLSTFYGADAARRKISELNKSVRDEQNAQVVDLVLRTGTCARLEPLTRQAVKLIDVPGHNEVDNDVVRECKEVAVSLCHCMLLLIRFDNLTSESTVSLIESLVQDAPHLLQPIRRQDKEFWPVVFVITQVDRLESRGLDDEDEDSGADVVALAREELRNVLRKRRSIASSSDFIERVPILATGITPDVAAGLSCTYDLGRLIEQLLEFGQHRQELVESRKLCLAWCAVPLFSVALHEWLEREEYPCAASEALLVQRKSRNQQMALSVLGMAALAMGGGLAAAAWAARGAALVQASMASATLASASSAAASASATAASTAAAAEAVLATSGACGAVCGYMGAAMAAAADGGLLSGAMASSVSAATGEVLAWFALGGVAATKSAIAAAVAASSAQAAVAAASATAASATATAAAATSAAAGYAGLALAGALTTASVALVGSEVLMMSPSLGCHGAKRALEELAPVSAGSVRRSAEPGGAPYEDFLLWPGTSNAVLYVGQFRGKRPHGHGRLFWKDTQFESFKGVFEDGDIKEGYLISRSRVVICSLRWKDGQGQGRVVLSGFQPESLFDPEEPCAVCLERPPLLAEGRLLEPCRHGCVCASCLASLTSCPLCREPITGTARV